jgi:hypothetical protein
VDRTWPKAMPAKRTSREQICRLAWLPAELLHFRTGQNVRDAAVGDGFLDDIKKQATKILGDKAKFPKERGDLDKAFDDVVKAGDAFHAVVDSLEDKILDVQKLAETYIVIAKQNMEVFSKDDFGLDEKSKDDAKKIKSAQQLYSSQINQRLKIWNDRLKVINELDKHCVEMGKYKSPKA